MRSKCRGDGPEPSASVCPRVAVGSAATSAKAPLEREQERRCTAGVAKDPLPLPSPPPSLLWLVAVAAVAERCVCSCLVRAPAAAASGQGRRQATTSLGQAASPDGADWVMPNLSTGLRALPASDLDQSRQPLCPRCFFQDSASNKPSAPRIQWLLSFRPPEDTAMPVKRPRAPP